jgi:hypothetical protein
MQHASHPTQGSTTTVPGKRKSTHAAAPVALNLAVPTVRNIPTASIPLPPTRFQKEEASTLETFIQEQKELSDFDTHQGTPDKTLKSLLLTCKDIDALVRDDAREALRETVMANPQCAQQFLQILTATCNNEDAFVRQAAREALEKAIIANPQLATAMPTNTMH